MGPSFIGQIFPIPVGQGGLVGTRDQSSISPDKLVVARNLSFFGLTLQKEGGAAKYNSSAISGAPAILGGWDFWPSSGVQRMVVLTSDGKLLKDTGSGAFGTTLKSGLNTTGIVPVFVEGGIEAAGNDRKLFVFTGSNKVQVLAADGATTHDITTPPADWGSAFPTTGTIHESRLMGAGNSNDPHRVYYSTAGDQEDFTGAGSGTISVYPGEGERIVQIMSYKGLLIVWKYPVGIYLIDTSNPDPANWRVQRLTKNVGGVSPMGGVPTDDDVLFVDAALNIHALSAVKEFGDLADSNLARQDHIYAFLQDNINLARLSFIRGVYYPGKRELHFAMASQGSSVNDVRFVIDFNTQTPRFRYSDRDVCEGLWLRKDSNTVPRLTAGDNAGFVWNLDQTSKLKDGAGYPASFQTPSLDFSYIDEKLGTVRKIGQFLELEVAPTGNWNLQVDVIWDGEVVQTVNFNMGSTGAALGSFVLGTDKLAGDQILTRKKRIVGSGRRLSLAGSNTGAGEDFAVGKFYLHCLVGDEREGRNQ